MQILDSVACIGAVISWWGTGTYLAGIARGNTRPRLASWIAWGTANTVLTFVALLNDNTLAAAFNGLAALGNICVLVLSAYKRAGQYPNNRTDWICLAITGACLAWILLFPKAMFWAAILAMAANIAATWPTIRHAWARPHEETWQLFAANAGANALGLIGVAAAGGMGLANVAGPFISMAGNMVLVAITFGRSWFATVGKEVQAEIAEVESQQTEQLVV